MLSLRTYTSNPTAAAPSFIRRAMWLGTDSCVVKQSRHLTTSKPEQGPQIPR